MKTPKKLLSLLTALALSLTMAAPALAAPSSDHITINKPKANATYYIGETIPLRATLTEYTLPKYDTVNFFRLGLVNLKAKQMIWSRELGDSSLFSLEEASNPIPFEDGFYQFSKNLSTSKYTAGKYAFEAYFYGDLTGKSAEIADDSDDYSAKYQLEEDASVNLTLKKLKAPTKLKAKAGKKKVTLSWKKAEGAKKYEIYRSTKKKSGYKKIATTTKTKYVNKKLKKGKRYYYKVRTLRGSVKSGFTNPVRSGKVKK